MTRDPMPAERRINPALICGLVGITVLVIYSKSMIGALGLLFLAVKLVLSARRPTAPRTDSSVDSLRVVVLVPMYNEDPEIIRRSVRSLLNQTHVPDRIHIIDDGSNSPDALDAVKDEVRNERTRVRLSRAIGSISGSETRSPLPHRWNATPTSSCPLTPTPFLTLARSLHCSAPFVISVSWARLRSYAS